MAESMNDYKDQMDASFRNINEGDIITGTVIDVNEDEVTLDLNYYAQGIIKTEDMSNDPGFQAMSEIHEGDQIEATVISRDDGHGNIRLSRKEADDVLAWDKLKEYKENETVLPVKIREAVNAGVIAYLEGIRAFIPASQISADYVEDTGEWVGRTVNVQVITIDRENNKLVLSGRAVARKEKEEETNHRISMIIPGTVTEGTVESLMPYGAFVNIGNGLTGLVHISQICQKRIAKPSEVLKEGQHVKVKVLNTKDNKISLSMRALEDEGIDTEAGDDLNSDAEEYNSGESVSTSLGDLLKGFKLK